MPPTSNQAAVSVITSYAMKDATSITVHNIVEFVRRSLHYRRDLVSRKYELWSYDGETGIAGDAEERLLQLTSLDDVFLDAKTS